MLAMKEWVRHSSRILYSRCCVLDAPSGISDGSYTVFFDGHRVSAIKEGGLWLPDDRAELLPPDQRLDLEEDFSFRMEDAIKILPLLKNEAA
jgi:hypothetical protein